MWEHVCVCAWLCTRVRIVFPLCVWVCEGEHVFMLTEAAHVNSCAPVRVQVSEGLRVCMCVKECETQREVCGDVLCVIVCVHVWKQEQVVCLCVTVCKCELEMCVRLSCWEFSAQELKFFQQSKKITLSWMVSPVTDLWSTNSDSYEWLKNPCSSHQCPCFHLMLYWTTHCIMITLNLSLLYTFLSLYHLYSLTFCTYI